MLRDLFKDESGASAVEYSLLLGLIAIDCHGGDNHARSITLNRVQQFRHDNGKHRGFLTQVTGSHRRRAIAMETSMLLQLLAVTVLIGLASTYIKRII